MTEFLLYGIDETGRAAFSELLRGANRAGLAQLAEARLRDWPAVEVWEGPMCVLRLRRATRSGS